MAITEPAVSSRLSPIVDEVARALGRHGVKEGRVAGSSAALRITLEENVRRVVQVYWTPFEASVPGQSIGLHLEVAEPRVHWAEAYLSPEFRNWVFCFHERPTDGEIQLAYHADYATPSEAIEGFFNLSSWYILTATDHTWEDVTYELGPGIDWSEERRRVSAASTSAAVQESLKKSTILWMRWRDDGREHTMPVWFLYDNKAEAIYVLSGEREQTLPGAERIKECDVILRWKGKNARVAEIPARVRVIPPGEEWDAIAERVAEKRLNIPGLPEDTAKRWRDECHLLELKLRT
jgi:hypothetical protein